MQINRLREISFSPCQDDECFQLQRMVEEEATQADDTQDLATCFLIVHSVNTVQPFSDVPVPDVLAHSFLDGLAAPYSRYVPPEHAEHRFEELMRSEAENVMLRLLTRGASNEPPIFDDLSTARQFTHRVINLFGSNCRFLTNMKRDDVPVQPPGKDYRIISSASGFSVFKVGHCNDEGIIFVSPNRVGILWFLGYD